MRNVVKNAMAAKIAAEAPAESRPMTEASILTLVAADLAAMSGKALADAYNIISPEKPVNRFATPEDGRKRLALKIEARKLVARLAAGETAETAKAKVVAKGKAQVEALVASGAEMDKRLAKLNGLQTPPAPKAKKEGKPTIAGRCRELFTKGGGNDDVWQVVRAEFKLPDSKKWFVAWYRADEKRKAARAAYKVK